MWKLFVYILILQWNFDLFAKDKKTVYSIGEDISRPTVIKQYRDLKRDEVYMQDPLEPQTISVVKNTKVAPKNLLKIKKKQIKMPSSQIQGRYSNPQVEFVNEPLKEEIVFEPIEEEFIQKVNDVDFVTE